jgi:hypothetical protein
VSAPSHISNAPTTAKQVLLRKRFDAHDTNGGGLDWQEAQAGGMTVAVFKGFDLNHDGVISWEEYHCG